ncbi:TasA family protein [Microlunatus soli]|uniref:Alternate signal-mediated exported protein, RER_14450 family n=1 Tax=Microlunatus soli TaxID=630515 RepID=A0A1H1VIE7_9ACTN|nr:TasA family protein [Microlunatus soli]SDS84513.1 alternate signal-mediated exported protein, RER_14450 family [Microlunatus soli]
MTERHRWHRPRWVRLRAALALGAVGCLGVAGTFAYWTDSVPVSGTTITTGTLDLKVNGSDSLPSYTSLSISNMVPGNSTAAVLTVRNAGTVPLTYYATSTASSNLGSALTTKVTGATSTDGSGNAKTCSGTTLPNSGTAFGGNLVGTKSDQRSLSAGSSETVCIQATLPSTASSSLQGLTSNVTLSFEASQVI